MDSVKDIDQQLAPESQYTILVVEDDRSLREGISDLLEFEDGITVYSVCDGQEAIELLQEVTPDLIISDIMMPHVNGFELLKHVRNIPNLIRIPFIFLTARGSRDEVFEGRKSGAEMYITKPFDINELVDLAKTQLRRASEKKLANQEDISSFKRTVLQILNHEFRTPLTYVTAYYDMLADSIDLQKDGRNLGDYLHGILSGCDRLTNLIEDLILVVDVRDGKLADIYRQNAAPVESPNEFVESAIEQGRAILKKYNISLEFEPDQSGFKLWGVEDQIKILINHLVENAIKFTAYTAMLKKEGNIEITFAPTADDEWIELKIIDSGIGFPEEAGQKIFDVFYQFNRQQFEQQGSGVGLSIAKGITDIHGGSLSIKSENEDGCTAILKLPNFKGGPISSQPNPFAEEVKVANVLLVEDDPILLGSLVELLALSNDHFQFYTKTATNGKHALEVLENFTPDLIISDLVMPELDGMGLLKQVRDQGHLLHVPFIIVSAKNRDEDIFAGRKLGAEEYITKPYKADEFLAITEVQLRRFFEHQSAIDQDFDSFKEKILRMLQPEFLDPLGSVSANSNILASEEATIENAFDLRSALGEIHQGSEAISELVEDFISLAEIETGEANKAFDSKASSYFDFPNLINDVLQYHRSAFEHNQLEAAVINSSQGYGAMIDVSNLQKALTRLMGIVTSLCVSAEGKKISIEIDPFKSPDELTLSFWHNGPNLSSQEIANLVDSLAQTMAEDFNPMDFSSHLKIVDGFVKIHNGRFYLENGDENTPDKFTISLPRLDPPTNFDKKGFSGFTLQ